MEIEQLIIKAHLAVEETLKKELSSMFFFHNFSHTNLVIAASHEIGMKSGLSKIELQTVVLASIFHDVGYTKTCEGHEIESASFAANFLRGHKISLSMINDIEECIMSTKFPQEPSGLMHKVVCDADLYHLSAVNYDVFSQALKHETEMLTGVVQTDEVWDRANLQFLQNHNYLTQYGKNVLQVMKMKNMELIAARLKINSDFKSHN